MAKSFWQKTEDWHTAGEPFRIVRDLPAGCLSPGLTVCEQRAMIIKTPAHPLEQLRRSLCHEPRGHADMYGGFVVPPNDAGAHIGVLFFHNQGFSTACGHGTIALGHWAIVHGLVTPSTPDGEVDVIIDVPSGRVIARVGCCQGKPVFADFINVTSHQLRRDLSLHLSLGSRQFNVNVDVSFGGAVYVFVNADDLALQVAPENHQLFITLQRQVKSQMTQFLFQGKYDVYGVCFFQHLAETPERLEQRNVVVFADGQIDRSPCGSGTAARVAILFQQGRLTTQKYLLHHSIINSTFEARILSEGQEMNLFRSCVPSIRGTAHLTGRNEFYIDTDDKLYPGFLLR